MNEKAIFLYARELGCCLGCSVRCLGIKNPNAYENLKEYVSKNIIEDPISSTEDAKSDNNSSTLNITSTDSSPPIISSTDITSSKDNATTVDDQGEPKDRTLDQDAEDAEGPPMKKRRWSVCVCCLGVLQEETWPPCYVMVKEMLEKKCYESPTFACALSAPLATILRERAIGLLIVEKFLDFSINQITPLKEAWKWCFGSQLQKHIDKALDSGSISPLLIQLNIDYANELEELEVVKRLSPDFFKARSYQKKSRYPVEFTKRSVEDALVKVKTDGLKTEWTKLSNVSQSVTCVSVVCTHAPLYLGGRYIKLSRELCQTPWILNGVRIMESSVQEIIFDGIAKFFQIPPEEMEHRLKFISAGREDVDVRCLGNGRPFAIELADPKREPSPTELQAICDLISKDGRILVKELLPINRDDLTILKQGEETKSKTYEALCIKLGHNKDKMESNQNGAAPITVTENDILNINSFTNTAPNDECKIAITQKTPIRVLHRRPLLERRRMILDLKATSVPDHPQLFTIRVKTSAGTYIKEWVHGELGRAKPSLGDAIGAPVDILALDVVEVHLDWPKTKKT